MQLVIGIIALAIQHLYLLVHQIGNVEIGVIVLMEIKQELVMMLIHVEQQ